MKLGVFLLATSVVLFSLGAITVFSQLAGTVTKELFVAFQYGFLLSCVLLFLLGTAIVRWGYRLTKVAKKEENKEA